MQGINEKKVMEEARIRTNSPKAWLLAARPKTLTGAAVPVMIGAALAYVDSRAYGDDTFSWLAMVRKDSIMICWPFFSAAEPLSTLSL